jgi:hypothetical protein
MKGIKKPQALIYGHTMRLAKCIKAVLSIIIFVIEQSCTHRGDGQHKEARIPISSVVLEIHEQAGQTYPLHAAIAAEGKYYYQISL